MSAITYNEEGKIRLFNRRPLFWIITSATVIVLLTILIFLLNNALVKITYSWAPEARESGVGISTRSNSFEDEDKPVNFILGDYTFIPRDTKALYVTAEHSETIKHIDNLPFFSIPNISATLEPQSKLIKRGSESEGCNLLRGDRAFTHDCGNTQVSEFMQPTNDNWHLRTLEEDGVSNRFSRYKDGFLMLAYTDLNQSPDTLRYVSVGDAMRTVASSRLPDNFMQDINDAVFIYTDSANPDAPFIVGNLTTGRFLVYNNVGDEQASASFERDNDIDPTFENTLCDLTAGQFACYHGQLSTVHDNIEEHQEYLEEDDGLNRWGTLEVRDVDDIQNVRFHKRDIRFGIDEIYQDANNNLYTLSQDLLMTWNTDDFAYSLVSGGVDNITSGEEVIFTRNNGVYSYDDDRSSSILRFRSDHLLLASASSYAGNVLLNAMVQTENDGGIRNIGHVYQLTDTPLPASETRLEDILPFGNADENIGNMDYNDEYIQVSVIPAFGVSGQAQGLRYDREATLARRDEILRKLEELGVTENREVLFFVFGTSDNPQI